MIKATGVFSLIYPPTCICCGAVCNAGIGRSAGICPACSRKISYVEEPRCVICGKPVRYEETEMCYDCARNQHWFDGGRSVWMHKDPVTHSIHDFKYHNRKIYSEVYAEEMMRLYGQQLGRWNITGIIPIPIHRQKLRKRGYNQAQVLSERLAKQAGIPHYNKLLKRVRDTAPQKQLGHHERRKNLLTAFAISNIADIPENVLLVDDIYTTGSTIDSAAKLLKENGACKVYFLTISIGQGF